MTSELAVYSSSFPHAYYSNLNVVFAVLLSYFTYYHVELSVKYAVARAVAKDAIVVVIWNFEKKTFIFRSVTTKVILDPSLATFG